MTSVNRTGRVSAVDYESGTFEVVYTDRGRSVTRKINAVSNGEYRMPRVGQIVSVAHLSNGTAAGVSVGTVWNKTNRPVEGYRGLWRKEYGETPGRAYDRYDENTGVFSRHVDGTVETLVGGGFRLTARGGMTVTVTGGTAEITINGTAVKILQSGAVEIEAAGKISMHAQEIDISAPRGEVDVGGVKLTEHSHYASDE